MYKLLLIGKYLRRKLAPMFAALAVMLCTAMVMIVISVMGGFLTMMRASAQTLTGQITVYSDLTGFEGYKKLSELLLEHPDIEAATPLIRSYGLIKLHDVTKTVEVIGIEPATFTQVTGYRESLYWSKDDYLQMLDKMSPPLDERTPEIQKGIDRWKKSYDQMDLVEAGMTFQIPKPWSVGAIEYGCVMGIEVNPWNVRTDTGRYGIQNAGLGLPITLTVLPLAQSGSLQTLSPSVRKFAVVNEFKSGLYDVDANRVCVPFAVLQEMLDMHPKQVWETFDPQTGEPAGDPTIMPARISELMIQGRDGVALDQLKDDVQTIVNAFIASHRQQSPLWVQTWEERHATLLGAVEKEKGLLTVLFAIISVVAIVMIAVIFYMIVQDKTRDIGTLRAIGASRSGVASIFLGYGLAIGIVGSALGFALAASIVLNLNEIQDILFKLFGFKMWDPSVYYFERIPSQLDPKEVTIILLASVFSSLVGSVVPAWRASRQDPVEALRYE